MPVEWLMEGEAFIRYRTMIDLLNKNKNDKDVTSARRAISKEKLIKNILNNRNQYGYWGVPKDIYTWWPKKDTTFWMLGVLADFCLDKNTKEIAGACEYVLNTQLPDGGFGWAPPPTAGDCFTGILTESMAKLGYVSDKRLKKAYGWMIQRQRHDGGFWCKNTGQPGGPRENEPSCAFASLCILGAIAQNKELKRSKLARRCGEFLLTCWDNRGKIKYAGHDSKIGTGWEKLKYPFTDYRILKYLDILSQFEFLKKDKRIAEMMDLLISKQDDNGRFHAESIHKVWSQFDFGQKQQPSRWITFLVHRIARRLIN